MHVDFKQETAWYTHFATSHYYISDMLYRSLVTFDVRNTIDYQRKDVRNTIMDKCSSMIQHDS